MATAVGEPMETSSDEDEAELQRQDQAYMNAYENDHTWDQLQEDEHGNLTLDHAAEQRAKRIRLVSAAQSARIRKGMIRYLLLVIDLSRAASSQDLRPNRLTVMLTLARAFVRDFFDQNPLSQLGIAVMRAGVVEKITDLSGSPESQVARLNAATIGAAGGDASLQNALDHGVTTLSAIPPYGHREMLLLFAGLSTCDPGNIRDSIKAAKDANIRVSIVGVSAEVFICKRIAEETGGHYKVALSEQHLQELLLEHSPPPPTTAARAGADLVRMGFPQRSTDDASSAVFAGENARLIAGSYTCPRCHARVADLPCQCHACGLTLISSPHLARSYHHLFPVLPYDEVSPAELDAMQSSVCKAHSSGSHAELTPVHLSMSPCDQYCFGCLRDLLPHTFNHTQPGSGPDSRAVAAAAAQRKQEAGPLVLRCPKCRRCFCFDCDVYVHENLHNCPGCEFGIGAASAQIDSIG